MDILKTIKNRRTIRKYRSDKKIPKAMIGKIIEAGRWAPSAHNLQPWKFVVLSNKCKIGEISSILREKSKSMFIGFNIVMRDTASRLANSPMLILAYNNCVISNKAKNLTSRYVEVNHMYEIQSVAGAIENMLLCAHSVGVGAAWYGMPVFCEREINDLLGQSDRLVAILSLGYPAEKPKVTSRKRKKEIVEYIS